MEQKIEIPNFNFKDHEIIDAFPDCLTLSDFDIEYKWKLTAIVKDDGVETERKYQGNKSILKNKIIGVEAIWDEDKECYVVTVFSANKEAMSTAHKTFLEALKLKETIMNWLKT